MGAPPYIAAVGLLFGGAYLADRFKKRVWLITLQALMCITGLALVIPGPSDNVRFLGTFFAVMGAQCNTPAILAFQQNNVVGSSKRSVATAVNTGAGAIGGIIGRYFSTRNR
jgi:predicted MFS family arabinose efflux permease